MQPARDDVIALLKGHRGLTLADAARQFGITREGVRQIADGIEGAHRHRNSPPPGYMTVAEAARKWGVSWCSVDKRCYHGLVGFIRVGSQRYIPEHSGLERQRRCRQCGTSIAPRSHYCQECRALRRAESIRRASWRFILKTKGHPIPKSILPLSSSGALTSLKSMV